MLASTAECAPGRCARIWWSAKTLTALNVVEGHAVVARFVVKEILSSRTADFLLIIDTLLL